MPTYFLNDFAYTSALIGEFGLPNLKLQFDVYHRQILHGDVTMSFRAQQPIVGHIQVASVPSRHEPDGEELNFPYLFAEFDRLGSTPRRGRSRKSGASGCRCWKFGSTNATAKLIGMRSPT